MHTVLQLCPFPPQMRTDCLSLLKTAEGGTTSATRASRPLARIWHRIGQTLGADISTLMATGVLVWVPAHLNHGAVGEVRLSSGLRLTSVDWRANRLVDKLAKVAAGAATEPKHVTDLVASFEAATVYAAALLGVVTHAANNCVVEEMDEGGKLVTRTRRDSVEKPKEKRTRKELMSAHPVATAVPATRAPKVAAPWKPARKVKAATRERLAQEEATARRVAQIGLSLSAGSSRDRLATVRERILRRVAAPTACVGDSGGSSSVPQDGC